MSSLLDKIRSAVNASLRGARRPERMRETPAQDAPRPTAPLEIEDADPNKVELPEVTEAPLVESTLRTDSTPHEDSRIQVAEKPQGPDVDVDLEDERIVDLLQDDDA